MILSILKQIIEAEQTALNLKKQAEEEKQTLIEQARALAKKEEIRLLEEAKQEALSIEVETKKQLSDLDEAFLKELEKIKVDLVKDIDENIDKSVKFLIDKVMHT